MRELNDITGDVIGSAMEVHSVLGPGFLESVYHKALAYEMSLLGLGYESKKKLAVMYKDIVAGDFEADFLVKDEVIVELKAVENIIRAHHVQTVNYLSATGKDVGLLLNFGNKSLQYFRKHRTQKNPVNPVNPV